MMARRGWESLSPTYRKRLERGGVTKGEYESGASIRKARGHEKTPEKPTSGTIADYPEYFDKRARLTRAVIERKKELWGDRIRYNGERSADMVRETTPPIRQLEWFLNAEEEDLIDAIREDNETYAFIGYH